MTTKVKGLLKGLRYISQIFDDQKEEEIQIGFPTDVKHVAHIGSDDPSANAPSWMTEFKSAQGPSPGTTNATETVEEHNTNSQSKGSKIRHLIPKSRHHSMENDSNTTKHKHTRRHRSSDSPSDSPANESSGSSRHRRHRRGSNHGSESASQELPPTGSKSSHHRRKSKSVSSEEGSEKKHSSRATRRSKGGDSLTDISLPEIGAESGHVRVE